MIASRIRAETREPGVVSLCITQMVRVCGYLPRFLPKKVSAAEERISVAHVFTDDVWVGLELVR